jgi:hypothetical protein
LSSSESDSPSLQLAAWLGLVEAMIAVLKVISPRALRSSVSTTSTLQPAVAPPPLRRPLEAVVYSENVPIVHDPRDPRDPMERNERIDSDAH